MEEELAPVPSSLLEFTINVDATMVNKKRENHNNNASKESNTTYKPFRPHQEGRWQQRFHDLLEFRKTHKHCLVPHNYPANPALANWVKRQRYQYHLLFCRGGKKHKSSSSNKSSCMTMERIQLLCKAGFVWDSHEAAWQEKLKDLLEYKAKYGHCNVPARSRVNPQLATWVKCQRRQYKLYTAGHVSYMTPDRIMALETNGFQWCCRRAENKKNKKNATEIVPPRTRETRMKFSRDSSLQSSEMSNNNLPGGERELQEYNIFMDVLSDLEEDDSIHNDYDNDDASFSGPPKSKEKVDQQQQQLSLYEFLPDDTDYEIFLDGLSKLSNIAPITERLFE